jgi:hypothetical protein
MFLEFDLVFFIIFLFFKIFEFEFQNLPNFEFGPVRIRLISAKFRKIGRFFLTLS